MEPQSSITAERRSSGSFSPSLPSNGVSSNWHSSQVSDRPRALEAKVVILGAQGEYSLRWSLDTRELLHYMHISSSLVYTPFSLPISPYSPPSHTHSLPPGVGKTSLVLRNLGGTFSEAVLPTIGASFFSFNM